MDTYTKQNIYIDSYLYALLLFNIIVSVQLETFIKSPFVRNWVN